jgi:hypothetical protein
MYLIGTDRKLGRVQRKQMKIVSNSADTEVGKGKPEGKN